MLLMSNPAVKPITNTKQQRRECRLIYMGFNLKKICLGAPRKLSCLAIHLFEAYRKHNRIWFWTLTLKLFHFHFAFFVTVL